MFDLAALKFVLIDSVQVLTLVTIVSVPVAIVVVAVLWIVARKKRAN